MNITRMIISITISIIITAVLLGAFSYFIDDSLFSGSGSWIGLGEEPWQFKVILTAIYGAIIGAVAGAVICSFNFNLIIGIGFNLLLSLVSIGILVFILGPDWSKGMTKISYASVIVSMINGAIISLLNSSPPIE